MSHSIPSRQVNAILSGDPVERNEIEWFVYDGDGPSTSPLLETRIEQQSKRRRRLNTVVDTLRSPPKGSDLFRHHYQHRALPHADALRLIELSPGSGRSSILPCYFPVFDRDSAPAYEALSYRWSGPRDSFLLCNGKSLRIQRNLMHLLTRLRLPDRPRLIWVDAVCINQMDADEVSSQMALMRHTYGNAIRVIVWLGEDSEGQAEDAFERITSIALSQQIPRDKTWLITVAAFYGCDWFSRLWVFQEIAMAISADVLWGDESISWKTVSHATAVIRTLCYRELAQNPIPNLDNAYLFHQWSEAKKESIQAQESLLYMLQVTRKLHCTKAKDRINALVGFFPANACFPVAYRRRNTQSIYREVAKKILRQMQTLDVLSAVQHKSHIRKPTWVPRWNSWSVYSLTSLSVAYENYTASQHLPTPRIRWTGRWGELLLVSGVEFDTIVDFTPTIPISNGLEEQTTSIIEILTNLSTKACPYPTGESIDHVGCWTLTAGRDWYGMMVQDVAEHLADFVAFCTQNGADVQQHPSQSYHAPNAHHGDSVRFALAAGYASGGRRLFYTSKGYVGIGPAVMQCDDIVCVVSGGTTPFLLRHALPAKSMSRKFKLIGESYVHGIMRGEATIAYNTGGQKLLNFEIM